MNVELEPGDKLTITLKDSDGLFTITWGESALTVESDLPDQAGREGIIYQETWGTGTLPDDVPFREEDANKVLLSASDRERLHNALLDFAGVKLQVTRETTSIDFGYDSLDVSEVCFVLEEQFRVSFGNDFEWSTVGQLEDALAVRLQNATR